MVDDEQDRGPFAMFRHEYLFEPHGRGTRITNRVTCRSPLGPIGGLVENPTLVRASA
jgi:hypothetical protein